MWDTYVQIAYLKMNSSFKTTLPKGQNSLHKVFSVSTSQFSIKSSFETLKSEHARIANRYFSLQHSTVLTRF